MPLTAFCMPTGLYEWLVMPQDSSASPGWFVKVIDEVIKGLKQVAAYLDDVIVLILIRRRMSRRFAPSSSAFESITSSPLEGAIGCHRCKLPGPFHFPGGSTSERRKSVRINQYADAHGCEAGPGTVGWYQLLPHIFARLVQEASPN